MSIVDNEPFPGTSVSTFHTSNCALPRDLVSLLCKFAWGVCPKKHLFHDLAHVHAYQCAVPPIFINQFVPRMSNIPDMDHKLAYAESLILSRYDPWFGFQPLHTGDFIPNPYRRGNAYVPSNDLTRKGHWSNVLWFLMDIIRPLTRKFYRRSLLKQLRTCFQDGIEIWNTIWMALGPAIDTLEKKERYSTKFWFEKIWVANIIEQIGDASYVEDMLIPDGATGTLKGFDFKLGDELMRTFRGRRPY